MTAQRTFLLKTRAAESADEIYDFYALLTVHHHLAQELLAYRKNAQVLWEDPKFCGVVLTGSHVRYYQGRDFSFEAQQYFIHGGFGPLGYCDLPDRFAIPPRPRRSRQEATHLRYNHLHWTAEVATILGGPAQGLLTFALPYSFLEAFI